MNQLHIAFDKTHVTVETDVPEAVDFVKRTFVHMLSDCAPQPIATIRFSADSHGYSLSAPESAEIKDEWLEHMTGLLKDEVRHQFIRARSDLLWLHSGAVERNGGARLICGPSGAGKSTLTTMLCERGWRLLSDDVVPIRMDADSALPFAHAPSRRLRPLRFLTQIELNGVKREEMNFDRKSIRHSAAPIRDIVFPVFADAEESLSLMSSAEATMELLRSSMNFAAHRANAVARAARLASSVPAYRLVYQSARSAVDLIEQLG